MTKTVYVLKYKNAYMFCFFLIYEEVYMPRKGWTFLSFIFIFTTTWMDVEMPLNIRLHIITHASSTTLKICWSSAILPAVLHWRGSLTAKEQRSLHKAVAIYSAHIINSSHVPVNYLSNHIVKLRKDDQWLIYRANIETDLTKCFTIHH